MKYLMILSFNLILILSCQSFVDGLVSGKRGGDSDDGDNNITSESIQASQNSWATMMLVTTLCR